MKKLKTIQVACAALFGAAQAWGVDVSTWADLKSNLEAGYDVKLTQDITQNDVGVAIKGGAMTLDLNGFKITGSKQSDIEYRLFTLSNNANLSLADGSDAQTGAIDGSGALRDINGGCFYVSTNATFTMNGGMITNCMSTSANPYGYGGAVYSDGTFTMNGGTIAGCKARQGGAVTHTGKFTLNGGTISGNYASSYGYAIRPLEPAEFTMTGGEIINNWGDREGAIGNGSNTKVTITGGVMRGNDKSPASTTEKNKLIQSYEALTTVSGGVFDAEPSYENITYQNGDKGSSVATYKKVGSLWVVGTNIACNANNELTAGTYTFCPTNAEYVAAGLKIADGYAAGKATATTWGVGSHVHCICGDGECTAAGHEHVDLAWQKWTSTTTLPDTAGNWYLADDVTLTAEYAPSSGVNICLNGHNVTRSDSAGGSIFKLNAGCVFALSDCAKSGAITGNNGGYARDSNWWGGSGKGVYFAGAATESAATFNMYGGIFQNFPGSSAAIGQVIDGVGGTRTGHTVNMYGGAFLNNCTDAGSKYSCHGAVASGCTFKMYGGEISGNKGKEGACFFDTPLYIYGGLVKDNYSDSAGLLSYGWAVVSGGVITNNSTGTGSLFNCNTVVTGGEIVCNRIGGVSGTLTVGGTARIVDNTNAAGTIPCNVYLSSGNTMTVSEDVPFAAGAQIGVYPATKPTEGSPVAVTSNRGADYGYFTSDIPTYLPVNEDGVVKLVKGSAFGEATYAYVADGVCTIYGTGATWDFTEKDNPLDASWASVKDVVVADGVTGLGAYTFYKFYNLTNMTVAASVTNLGKGSIYLCHSLESVSFLGKSVPLMGENVLNLKAGIVIEGGVPVVTLVPKVTVDGKEPTLMGTNDLEDGGTWEEVAPGETGNYHFFKYVIQ